MQIRRWQLLCACIFSLLQNPSSLAQSSQAISIFQQEEEKVGDPCGFDPIAAQALLAALGPGWGYNYDSLRVDLRQWQQSPYVVIDSIGASVQNRALWLLTITSPHTASEPRMRLWVHARTHPGEVQAWWVTEEMIKILLGETPLAHRLRERCIINIMPMYNPDGVELGYGRQNANGVDIESNWDKNPNEPEVIILRNQFLQFMASPSPIRVALNMHSALACKRFFVYHDASGTSPAFAVDEQHFISSVRQHFLSGIENWDHFVSWINRTPTQYPESWFWLNHREAVMALTYEDMNCASAGQYDRTAFALLQGIADYLGLTPTAITDTPELPADFSLAQSYPNPMNIGQASGNSTFIRYSVGRSMPVRLALYDILGREIAVLRDGPAPPGSYQVELNATDLASGVYFYRLQTRNGTLTRRLLIAR